ncbi:hypothetical protein GCM10029964_028220 [Kibdelosporangium lantanae]
MAVWARVIEDFDSYLDSPGAASDRAMDKLLAYLGITLDASTDAVAMEWWSSRVGAAAESTRLTDALAHEDVEIRRIAAFVLTYRGGGTYVEVDDVPTRLALAIAGGTDATDALARFGDAFGALLTKRAVPAVDALLLCHGEPGAVLTKLPWADPEWQTPVEAVEELLDRFPEVHAAWLRMVAEREPERVPELADAAAKTGAQDLMGPYGISLLHHPDPEVREKAIYRDWRSDAYQEAVAALLDDPEVGLSAADRLAWLGDRRALPHLVGQVERVGRLARCGEFGAELLPYVIRRLDDEPSADLLLDAALWGEPKLLHRPEAAAVVGRLTDEDDLVRVILRVGQWKPISPEMRSQLLYLATASDSLRVRQNAQSALLNAGETVWLVPVLVKEILRHPVRTGADGPWTTDMGWRADALACSWLGRIGPAAHEAVPVLTAMLTETGEAGKAREDAAKALALISPG